MIDIDESYQLTYTHDIHDTHDTHDIHDTHDTNTKVTFTDKLFEKLKKKDLSEFPKGTSLFSGGLEFFRLVFSNNKELHIFRFPIECKFKDLTKPIKILSFEHLKIILEKKIKENIYKQPYYYSENSRKDIYIDIDKIEKSRIYIDKYIEIKDKDINNYLPNLENDYNNLDNIYKKKNIDEFPYQFISPNFKSYINKLKINLTDDFHFIYTQNRIILKSRIDDFLDENNSSYLYPICGPHGTGKTISILNYHKELFRQNKKGLYLNLKFYCNNQIKLEEKIEILTKECFFICDNKDEYISLYNKLIIETDIYELFSIINDFIISKNKKNNEIKEDKKINETKEDNKNIEKTDNEKNEEKKKNNENDKNDEKKENIGKIDNNKKTDNNENKEKTDNKEKVDNIENNTNNKIYIIFDQYQNILSMGRLFELFKNIKIILLSSINDFDVKNNIILKYEEEIQKKFNRIENNNNIIIRYHYIDDLINEEYYNSDIFKNLIKNKIRKEKEEKNQMIDENEIDEKFKFIYDILKDFAFIPKYFFEYLYYYDSILDLLFNEYSNIMKKLDDFLLNKLIDLESIKKLENKKHLIQQKDIKKVCTIQKNRFIEAIKIIPLKYINFKACKNGEFYFYYSFPLFSEILKDFIKFQNDKKKYFIINDGSERGNIFERLVKYQFRIFKKFNVDGYFEVEKIIDMNPTEKYQHYIKEYISSKNNIFIDQKKSGGDDYDFAIYQRESKKLLLFQAKYLISNSNIQHKSYYSKSAVVILNKLNKYTEQKITEVHLLYISSMYYNYDIRQNAVNILKNHNINCIFYSLQKDLFYFNFKDDIDNLLLTNSNILVPKEFSNYESQEALDNQDFEREDGMYHKHEKKKTNKKSQTKDEEKSKTEEDNNKDDKIEENFEDVIFLKKKTISSLKDLDQIYDDLMRYINVNSKFKDNSIINLLGPIKSVSYSETRFNKNKEYAIIFDLNAETSEINYNNKIGLIIYNNGVTHFIDLVENLIYKNYDEFIEKFKINTLFAIGDKK